MDMMALDEKYIAPTYRRYPVELVSGKGCIAVDADGKEYIDMGSGIGVNCFGYADPVWAAAVAAQAGMLQHTSNLYYTEPCARLAQLLCSRTGMKKVFFANSGAEANECAIKVARKYSAEKKGQDFYTIITLKNSFHGRTLTTLAATGQEKFHELFQPLTPGFVSVEANDIHQLEETVAKTKVAGIALECVQGEGGVIALDKGYLQAVAQLAAKEDIPLIVDEVQTGNGRTGKLYAYMHFGIQPDIVTTAKGLGGGLPIGACLMAPKVQHVLTAGDHGSTYGGNPVCCAGALSVLERMDDAFLAAVVQKGDYVFQTLNHAKGVEQVSGLGLMIGVKTTSPVSEIVEKCAMRGVLCLKAKDKLRLLPPLNIPMEQLKTAVETIKSVCAEE